jgi:hypothetical protein
MWIPRVEKGCGQASHQIEVAGAGLSWSSRRRLAARLHGGAGNNAEAHCTGVCSTSSTATSVPRGVQLRAGMRGHCGTQLTRHVVVGTQGYLAPPITSNTDSSHPKVGVSGKERTRSWTTPTRATNRLLSESAEEARAGGHGSADARI